MTEFTRDQLRDDLDCALALAMTLAYQSLNADDRENNVRYIEVATIIERAIDTLEEGRA